jgi:hypothetical protein
MASVNFININIAGSLKRAKEVGIRKSTGSSSDAGTIAVSGRIGHSLLFYIDTRDSIHFCIATRL